MKRNVFLLMMLAVVLAFTMAVVGCSNPAGGNNTNNNTNTGDDPNTGDNPGGNSGTLPAAKGKLTINGLGGFDGKYIYGDGLTASGIPLFLRVGMTGPETDPTFKLAAISGGKAEVPLYYVEDAGAVAVYKAYEGNDQVRTLSMYIVEVAELKTDNLASVLTNNLGTKRIVDEGTFNGGNLTIDWGGEGGDNPGGGEKPFEYPASSIDSTEIERIAAYLAGQSGGTSASNPVNLSVNLQLSEANVWALLDAIGKAGKYVSLDLSACTLGYYEYHDDGYFSLSTRINVNSGKNKIVALAPPNTVTSIGYNTFYGCTSLTSVSFPNVTSIGDYDDYYGAFGSCDSLTSVDIPANTPYGYWAFYGCPWQPTW